MRSKINHPINQMTKDFIDIFEKMGATFIDVTDECKPVKNLKKNVRKSKTS